MMSRVVSVSKNADHGFSKQPCEFIQLIEGFGVEGDAHAGKTVQHRSRIRLFGSNPNLRQVHLIHQELFEELKTEGFEIQPGDIGENITTSGIPLLNLPESTILRIGSEAVIQITGLRNPCKQLNDFKPGLMHAVLEKTVDGQLIRKSGVMGVVIHGGIIRPGDSIQVELPSKPHRPLDKI